MKKFLFALATLLLSPLVQAEVAGVYLSSADPALIVTVHHNGNSLLVLHHAPTLYGATLDMGNGQSVTPLAGNALTYLLGQLSADGQSATVIGTGAGGLCAATYQLKFSDAGLRMSLQALQATAISAQFGVDCPALATQQKADEQSVGGAPLLVKIF